MGGRVTDIDSTCHHVLSLSGNSTGTHLIQAGSRCRQRQYIMALAPALGRHNRLIAGAAMVVYYQR